MGKPASGSVAPQAAAVMPHGQWPGLMSKQLASAYIDVSQRTFERLISSGEIRGVVINGSRLIRYRRTDLDAYVAGLPHGRGEAPCG